MFKNLLVIPALLAGTVFTEASASQLVYQPTNPTFGGPSSNGSVFMATAAANNHFKDNSSTTPTVSPTQAIANQITQSVLANIASKITSQINGGANSGSYTVGGSTISFNTQGQNIVLTVNDGSGGLTTITIPSPNV